MAQARFVGPEPHEVPLLGRRIVQPDELVDVPGELVTELADGWLLAPAGADPAGPAAFVLPKAYWQVEDQPRPRPAKVKE